MRNDGMKTLDEIIEAMKYCTYIESDCLECPFYSAPDCGVQDDALAYLKEYRSEKLIWEDYRKNLSDMVMKRAKAYEDAAKRLIEKYKELDIGMLNPPLTWDELCMLDAIGEPVWNGSSRRWMLIIDSAADGTWIELINHAGGKERWIQHDLLKAKLYRKPMVKSEK